MNKNIRASVTQTKNGTIVGFHGLPADIIEELPGEAHESKGRNKVRMKTVRVGKRQVNFFQAVG